MEEIYNLLIESHFCTCSTMLFKLGPGDKFYIKTKHYNFWRLWDGSVTNDVKKVTVLTDDEYFLEKL